MALPDLIGMKALLVLAAVLLAGLTLVMTAVFYYHWARYAPSGVTAIGVISAYTLGAIVFLLGMFGALAGIS